MTEKMQRLSREGDFVRIFRQGKRKRAGFLKVFFLPRERGSLRVAFVGKSKKAVHRNRIRRRLKEAFRTSFYSHWRTKPVDLLFWSDEQICTARFADIQSWMGQLLEEVSADNGTRESREC